MRDNEEPDNSTEERSNDWRSSPFKMFRRSFKNNIEAPIVLFQQIGRRKNTNNNVSTTHEQRDQPYRIFRSFGSQKPKQKKVVDDDGKENQHNEPCATVVLQHSYFRCNKDEDNPEFSEVDSINMPEDPTVQESFECVFPSQLQQGLPHELLWEESSVVTSSSAESLSRNSDLVSPASFQQSLCKTRNSSIVRQRKKFQTGALVHVGTYGTYDPYSRETVKNEESLVVQSSLSEVPIEVRTPAHIDSNSTPSWYRYNDNQFPQINPEDWPQQTLLFRPSPGSGIRVKGIRFVHSKEYLWKEGDMHTWVQSLYKHWGKSYDGGLGDDSFQECMILPINNGNELKGETIVVDFVSPIFEGTIQVRLRHTNGTTKLPYNDNEGYFKGLNRRYQVVVQGRPLKELSLRNLVTGFQLNHSLGKLPPKWITKGALRLINFFTPQLKTQLDGPKPKCISPLGSTPQMIRVNGDLDMEPKQEEPSTAEQSILGIASTASTTFGRAKTRKKNFDKLYTDSCSRIPSLSPSNVYTFEFLQHLVDFTSFSIELGSMLGSIPLKELLDGQPLQIMAMHDITDEKLWSFDVWHKELIGDAKRHDGNISNA